MKQLKNVIFCLLFVSFTAMAQQTSKNLQGMVVDENSEPLVGVSITVPGASVGTVSDLEGKFKINLPPGITTLQCTYLGYGTTNVNIENQTEITIRLKPIIQDIDEVVVIGYGTVKKRDLTGAVASVKSKDIVSSPTGNAMEALQGKVAGLDIVRTSGEAGKEPEITLRGNRSINGKNDPLFIIDGMMGGRFEDLNPSDIETVDILKDASSTAIYGAQGSNGVIIITTKKGTPGKTSVSYDAYVGVNSNVQYPEPLMGDAFMNYRREAYRSIGAWNNSADDVNAFTSDELQAIQDNKWVNWIDLGTRTGTHQSHTVSIRGGSDKTQSFISLGYFQEQGVFRGNEAQRYNARANVDYTVNSLLKAGIYSQTIYWNKDRVNSSFLGSAAVAFPLATPYDENGEIVLFPMIGRPASFSPLADYVENKAKDNERRLNSSLNPYIELTPLKGLTLRSNFGANLRFVKRSRFFGNNSLQMQTNPATASINNQSSYYLTWDNILNYKTTLGEDHSLGLMMLSSWTQYEYEESEGANSEQSRDSYLWYNLASGNASLNKVSSRYEGKKTRSYAARLEYNYKSKYLFMASFRRDGASVLAEGNKWHSFPSVSGAWVISEEAFMENVNWTNFLKLRANYGISGNAAIDPYSTQTGLVIAPSWGFSEISAPTYSYSTRVGNKLLTWEKSKTFDIGLDYSILKSRINLTVDFYVTKTRDILMERDMPTAPFGTGVKMWQNIAATENKGFELTLNTLNIKSKDFQWNSTLTFSKDNEKITDLVDGRNIIAKNDLDYSLLIGKPIRSWWDLKKLGIWQLSEEAEMEKYSYYGTKPQPGDIKVLDADGNYEIQDDDEVYVGSNSPKWIGGLQNTFRYKNFDLSVYMFARWGQTIAAKYMYGYNPAGAVSSGNGMQQANIYTEMDYWTPENPTNDFPRPAAGTILPTTGRALYFVDGSYFKIKTLTAGYTLPKDLLKRLKIENIRIYVTANNLFTKTKSHLLMHYDPEGNGGNEMPLYKTFVGGISLSF
jgi:TonB-linked SusC/RagA family outer membrane protein